MPAGVPQIISALTTPFTPDGAIALEAFVANLDRLEPLVDAVFVAGTTGEFPALDADERAVLTREALAVFGPARVVVHVGAASTRQALQITRSALDLGATRFAALTPYYLAASPAGVAAHFAALRSVIGDLQLYGYLFPDVAVTDVLPADIAPVLDAGIDGLKLSGAASTRVGAYIAAAPAGFSVWSGNDADVPGVLAAGGIGTVSGVSGVFPQPWVDLREAYRTGDEAAVDAAQQRISALVTLLGPSIARLKFALEVQHLPTGASRMTIDPPAPPVRQQISDLLAHTQPAPAG